MDTSESDQEIVHSDDLLGIVEKIIDFEEFDASSGREYAATRITLLANGEDIDDLDWDDKPGILLRQKYRRLLEQRRIIRKALRAGEKDALVKEAARVAAENAERQAKEKREHDLEMLARLKAEYEPETFRA